MLKTKIRKFIVSPLLVLLMLISSMTCCLGIIPANAIAVSNGDLEISSTPIGVLYIDTANKALLSDPTDTSSEIGKTVNGQWVNFYGMYEVSSLKKYYLINAEQSEVGNYGGWVLSSAFGYPTNQQDMNSPYNGDYENISAYFGCMRGKCEGQKIIAGNDVTCSDTIALYKTPGKYVYDIVNGTRSDNSSGTVISAGTYYASEYAVRAEDGVYTEWYYLPEYSGWVCDVTPNATELGTYTLGTNMNRRRMGPGYTYRRVATSYAKGTYPFTMIVEDVYFDAEGVDVGSTWYKTEDTWMSSYVIENSKGSVNYTEATEASSETTPSTETKPTTETEPVETTPSTETEPTTETEPVQEETTEPRFVVSDAVTSAGSTITVKVSTKDNVGIVSAKLKISYDATKLELVSVEGKDFENISYGDITSNPFILNWVDAINEDNTTDGDMAILTFKVKDDAEIGDTKISVDYNPDDVFNYDFENVAFSTIDGTVSIIKYVSGDLNDDGKINNKDLALLQRVLNGYDDKINELAADVNRDGALDNKDYGILQRHLNGMDVVLK